MGTLIVLSLSNLAVMLLTAWLLHRKEHSLPPISLPAKAEVEQPDDEQPTGTYEKGRNVL